MKQSKYIIGLTGGIACGKSTVAAYLRDLGVPVLDADAVSHALTAPGGKALAAIRDTFGDEVFTDGQLDRRALGRVVFGNNEAIKKLNAILHPLVIAEMEQQTSECQSPVIAWDVPLLFEAGMHTRCGETWCVRVPREMQIRRIAKRDGLDESAAAKRIDAQMDLNQKADLSDHVIDNSGSLENTRLRVKKLLRSAQRRLNRERD